MDPQFEQRKQDHIRLALQDRHQIELRDLDQIALRHEALPELNLDKVSLRTHTLGLIQATPFLISSMTAGHVDAIDLNVRLATLAADRGWLMGVGSQRKELYFSEAKLEWVEVRKRAPKARLLGNLGLAQLIESRVVDVLLLAESLSAVGMIIHLNPLQECLQAEGTPQFRGGLQKIKELCHDSPIPVVIKETGCGFSRETVERLKDVGAAALDVSGASGTHWGRIEGSRAEEGSLWNGSAKTFADWGIGTARSLINVQKAQWESEIWGSGGARSGLDAAKMVAMGANVVGFAKPILEAALAGEAEANRLMERIEFELAVAMFCTGSGDLDALRTRGVWEWQTR